MRQPWCGVRQGRRYRRARELCVSIHVPRVGCDQLEARTTITPVTFQFTHLVWGATLVAHGLIPSCSFNSRTPCGVRLRLQTLSEGDKLVSIHAPRVGCDSTQRVTVPFATGFNSRTPCGVRHCDSIITIHIQLFQFTHPVWGATYYTLEGGKSKRVSIHAPRVGCDNKEWSL